MLRKINKTHIYYTLFTLLLLIFFLYARFPSKVVETYIVNAAAERYPQAFVSLSSVSVALPPGLILENMLFGFRDDLEANIRLDQCRVRPRLLGYLTGRSSFAVRAIAYGGSLQGVVNYADFTPKKIPSDAEVRFQGINLDKIAYLKKKLGRQISGALGGSYRYKGDSQLDFTIQKGSYQLLEQMFGMDKLDFNTLEGQLSLKGGVLKVTRLNLKGANFNCSLKGDITLNSDFKKSVLNMSGSVEIAALNNKKISILLTGTLDNVQAKYI